METEPSLEVFAHFLFFRLFLFATISFLQSEQPDPLCEEIPLGSF